MNAFLDLPAGDKEEKKMTNPATQPLKSACADCSNRAICSVVMVNASPHSLAADDLRFRQAGVKAQAKNL